MSERQTNKNCPECFGAALWTDDDILWCPKCSYSAACAAQPVRRNQHERGIPDGLLRAKRQAKKCLADRPDVTGVGIGDGKVRVYLKDEEGKLGIPETFGDFPVEFVVTDIINLYETGTTEGQG